jgi:lipid-binding SYLF domain-containing protein
MRSLIRFPLLAGLAVIAATLASCAADTPAEKAADRATLQRVVESSAETITRFRQGDDAAKVNSLLSDARGVLVFPDITRAALIGGGAGGFGVLAGRSARGVWSSPAFMAYGGATFGLQAGVEIASVLAIINNDKMVAALANGDPVFGGSANVVFGGGPSEQPTKLATADVVVFAQSSSGAFAGANVLGGVVDPANEKNALYYGRPAPAELVVVRQEISSPDAAVLQRALAK